MGLAIKTDDAAVAGGGITGRMIMAKAAAEHQISSRVGFSATTATVKIFIDIFIGVWAFILGHIWTNQPYRQGRIRPSPSKSGSGFRSSFGFVLVFAVSLGLRWLDATRSALQHEANVFRVIFFVLTFMSVGVSVSESCEQGFGKLAWTSRQPVRLRDLGWLADLWLLFSGIKPPLAT